MIHVEQNWTWDTQTWDNIVHTAHAWSECFGRIGWHDRLVTCMHAQLHNIVSDHIKLMWLIYSCYENNGRIHTNNIHSTLSHTTKPVQYVHTHTIATHNIIMCI